MLKKNTVMVAWVVWGLGAAYFFCDYFARVSPGVMVPQLMDAFQVTAFGLGGLSAYFYYPYVAMQVPVGMLVDKWGVRRMLITMSFLTGVSCFLFGSAQVLEIAKLGRFLIGFSAAFAFVSALKLASEWFPSTRFGMLAGLTQALGMLGAFVGQYPVSVSVHWFGWRETMFIMTGVFFFLSFLILLFVRDKKGDSELENHALANISPFKALGMVLRNPQSWWNGIYVGCVFAPTGVFGELWGSSYLTHVQGFSADLAAFANGMIFIGWGVGGPLFGWISDRLMRRKSMLIFSAVSGVILMGSVLYLPNLPAPVILTLLFLFGVTNNGVAISYAVASEINPKPIAGVSMAFANMMSVIVSMFLQPLIGFLIDYHAGDRVVNGVIQFTAGDFRYAMILLPLCSLIGVATGFFVKETYCKPLEESSTFKQEGISYA